MSLSFFFCKFLQKKNNIKKPEQLFLLIKIEILTRREDLHTRRLLTKAVLVLQQNV